MVGGRPFFLVPMASALLDGGIRPEHSASERMRIRLSNEIALSDAVTALVVGPLWAWLAQDWRWMPALWVLFLPDVAPLWLNRRGRYRLARNLAIVWSCILLGGLAWSAGPGCHIEVALMVTAVGTLVLLPPDERYHSVLATVPLLAIAGVFVARWLVPTEGLVPAAYQNAVFILAIALSTLNLTARFRALIAQSETRSVELAEARNVALKASEAKTRFLAHMSHEVRTPLAGVIGLTDVLLQTHPTAEQQTLLRRSKSSAHHLMELLNRILDLAKIESGTLELDRVAFDLLRCCGDAVDVVDQTARDKGLVVVLDTPVREPDWRTGDPLRLRQALVNLLGNAVKFTQQGEVRLRMTPTGPTSVCFSVEDTGVGMTTDQVARVFDAFQQADSGIARRFGGTGLGLTITRQLVELAGGTLGCESTPGEGTRFSFELELAQADSPTRSVLPVAGGTVAGLKVLVAEDHPVNQLVVRRMLERIEVRVTVVGNGRLAVEAVENDRYDIVLMDMQMPEVDGLTATATLRERGHTLPICGMTANAMQADLDACLASGMNEVLVKPVSLAQLTDALSRLTG